MAPTKTHHPSHAHNPQQPSPPHNTLTETTQPRTNASLNLFVLQRHNPNVTNILSIAPYAVIYTFNAATQAWDKSGCEGTLFVCQLASLPLPHDDFAEQGGDAGIERDETNDAGVPEEETVERYTLTVLNRRGLDNFSFDLTSPACVEVAGEYILLQRDAATLSGIAGAEDNNNDTVGQAQGHTPEAKGEEERVVHGVWIFAEPPPSSTAEMRGINARVMQECAALADASRRRAEEARAQRRQRRAMMQSSRREMLQDYQIPQGRPAQDGAIKGGYGVYGREIGGVDGSRTMPQIPASQNALLELFEKARLKYGSNG